MACSVFIYECVAFDETKDVPILECTFRFTWIIEGCCTCIPEEEVCEDGASLE